MVMSPDSTVEPASSELLECFHKFKMTHTLKQLIWRGTQWQYISCGVGDQVLMILPGAFRRAESAFFFIRLFEDSCRVITPSYPPLFSVQEMLAGLIHILDTEEIPVSTILGQSYGGWMAQLLVRCYPERFNRLILSSTGPLTVTWQEERILPLVLILLSRIPTRILRKLLKRAFRSEVSNFPAQERPFWEVFSTELFEHITKADILSHFRIACDAVNRKCLYGEGEVTNWEGKVLIVGSDTDKYVSGKDRQRLVEIYPQAKIKTIYNAGHVVAISEPTRFAAAVVEFFKS